MFDTILISNLSMFHQQVYNFMAEHKSFNVHKNVHETRADKRTRKIC